MEKDEIIKLVKSKIDCQFEIKLADVHNDSEVIIIPSVKDVLNGNINKTKNMKVRDVMKIFNVMQSNLYEEFHVVDKSDFMMITLVVAKKQIKEKTKYEENYLKVNVNVEGNNIKLYRSRAGYSSQKDFAELIGMNQQTLSSIEIEKYAPRRNDISTILGSLNVTYDELFNTDKLSVYITENNQRLLKEYMRDMVDILPINNTQYENNMFMVNFILKNFLENEKNKSLMHSTSNSQS